MALLNSCAIILASLYLKFFDEKTGLLVSLDSKMAEDLVSGYLDP